jgi:hypothetical protein
LPLRFSSSHATEAAEVQDPAEDYDQGESEHCVAVAVAFRGGLDRQDRDVILFTVV